MSGEIRVAAELGLLTGLHRSPIQAQALFIKRYLDVIHDVSAKREQRAEALKLAMGASGQWKFDSLFPEAFGEKTQSPPAEGASTEDVVVDSESWSASQRWDYSAVEWKTPTQAKEEYDEIMRKLAAKSHGTMNGNQITASIPHFGEWR